MFTSNNWTILDQQIRNLQLCERIPYLGPPIKRHCVRALHSKNAQKRDESNKVGTNIKNNDNNNRKINIR
jgi:hypothetical protein